MPENSLNARINALFARSQWSRARKLLEAALSRDPNNHWLLTQLGVTWYEQRKYAQALKTLEASRALVEDCPLTLWNLAGTLDALGRRKEAIELYGRLLDSKTTAREDPCWEDNAWAATLRADCVYRLGICFQRLAMAAEADRCFEHYACLLSQGIGGTYTLDDVIRRRRRAARNGRGNGAMTKELRSFVRSARAVASARA
jgi:tetratricopeptide (TPR) repeat protein